MQLAADPARQPLPAGLPGQEAVIFAEHIGGADDAGVGHDFAENLLAFGLDERKPASEPWCEPTQNGASGSAAEPRRAAGASCPSGCRSSRGAPGSRCSHLGIWREREKGFKKYV